MVRVSRNPVPSRRPLRLSLGQDLGEPKRRHDLHAQNLVSHEVPDVAPVSGHEQPAATADGCAEQRSILGRKVHIFFASFKGLVAGQNAVQTTERGIRVTVPAASAGKAWFLPFLGEAQAVEGQRDGANLVFVLPDVQKGAVVWFE